MKAVRDASGVLAGIYGVSQDISERKRVENALAEEAVRRRILVEQSRDGIVVLDQNGKVFEANQRYADMLGYTADEVRHLHVWDWDLQWTREELMEMVRSVDAAGDHFETRHRRKDGSYYDVEVSTNGVALGGQKRIFCVCRDITARKRAEEALRASEEKYRGIFEESVVVTYVFDNQKNFVDANQAGLDLLGYSREELLQMRMPDVDADTRAVLPAHQKLLAGERLVNYEHKLRRKDGAVISVLNNSRPLTDSQGNVVGMLSTLVDITDRRRSEELTRARLERVRRESAVLAEIAASPFVAEGRIREAAALLTQTVSNAFGIARVGVWLFNDDKTRLVNIDNFDAEVNAHTKGAVLHEHEFREEFAVLKSAKYVDASEALTDPRVSGYVESYIKPMRITSMLDAVIRARGESLGTLCFEHVDTPHRWEDDEIAFACQLADQVALAASNRMRNRHERMTNARLRLTELAADHSVEELLQGFLDEAELLTDSHIGFFHFVDEDQATVQLQMWSTNTMKTMCTAEGKGAHYPLDEAGVWADCVREKVPLIHNDYLRLPCRKGLPEGHAPIVRELVVPVYREQKIVAILGVGNKDDDYVQEDVDVTVELAEMAWEIISRKRAEGDRERLTLAIEQAAEAIVITDKNGAIQYVNPSFTRTTGYTRREAIGQNPRILRSGTHDAAFYGRMWETLARGETWNGRIVNKAKDGTLFTEEAAISPVRDASGDIVSYVAVKRDISREIELEAQLRQSQKMEAVGQLAGGVAHDFNNLLQAILGYSELATDALEEKHPAREALSEVVAAGQRAATLVAQLLAFGRRQTMQPQDLDLNEVVAGMLKMLGRVIGEHIRMSFVQGHGLWTVHADRGMIEQTLMNLVVNGRDAMPKGGVLTLSTDNRLIDEIYCERYPGVGPGRYVLLSVTDSGCGMSEQIREKAFEPFFTTKGPGKGSGLGLATVYGVVKQHHGAVELHSEIDKGTTFNVFLPAVERRAAHADSNVHIQVAGGTETILLAEDEATVRVLGKRVLEDAGYSVLTVKNGREAVAQFKQFGPGIDLLILDVIMPEMGGPEAYSSIRALRPDVAVLFVSGYPNDSTHFSVELSDENWVLPKPYSAQQLLEQVRQLLDLRKKINADPPSA
ncbi:MAG: PAS domain S-box protein [Candidatus Hydrogenedentes bacterium]|nr:PAS domain S-box protein [Candidatus Hydrogenedentota bacterium]